MSNVIPPPAACPADQPLSSREGDTPRPFRFLRRSGWASLLLLLAACAQPSTPTGSAPVPVTPSPAATASAPAGGVSPASRLIGTQAIFTAAANPVGVSLTLEGCRNDGSPPISLPNSAGRFVCPDPGALGGPDSAYTSGNLGKGWNELDLVPHRMISKTGNSAPASQTYGVALVVDKQDAGKPGYDVLSLPVLNMAYSDAACVAAVASDETLTPSGSGLGGTDVSLYRLVNVTQPKNVTCVYDYYARLALGAHLFPGASLHANLANTALGTAGIGARDVSLPVNELRPQGLDKDMSASQGRDQVWDVSKQPSPATVNFGDVCAVGAVSELPVKISVRWEIKQVVPGDVTLITHVYATNPASRTITVNVTDRIYQGSDQSTPVLDVVSSGPVEVPANRTNVEVLTHTSPFVTAASLVGTQFNDVATASYIDTVTGVPVPGQATASASARVTQGTTTNASASITDREVISGNALTFAVAAPSLGTFSSYTPGTFVTGPVDWSVSGQSAGGGVDFNKTIRLDGTVVTSGILSDVADLLGSDGFMASAQAAIEVSSSASVSLTLRKTIPDVLQAGESQTFSFTVKDSSAQTVATPSLTFGAGETARDVVITNLNPGSYTVSEDAATGWQPQPDQAVAITLPSCAGGVTFTNAVVPAAASVIKTTLPAGGQQGWDFTLTRTDLDPDVVVTAGTTDADGSVAFAAPLAEGSYTVTETPRAGYDLTSQSGCTFAVNYPADAGRRYSCAATNTQRGQIIVRKVTNPAGSTQRFVFSGSGGPDFSLSDGEANTSALLLPGTYSVSETLPAGWLQTGAGCSDGSPVGAIAVAPGETVTCTFTNTLQPRLTVIKVVENRYGGTRTGADFALTVDGAAVTSGVSIQQTIGTHSVGEGPVPFGYEQVGITGDCAADGRVTLAAGDVKTCTVTNRDRPASITIVKNARPGTGSFAFTTSGSGYNSFTLLGAAGGNINTQASLAAGSYTVRESSQLGWVLTGIGGDAADPYACTVTGSGGSSGTGNLNTQTASISLKNGDSVTCVFENTGQGVTRTQGFWSTHPQLAEIAWLGGSRSGNTFPGVAGAAGLGDRLLCGRSLDLPALMGGFWSSVSKTTSNTQRSALDQARMHLLQQLLAAELNASAFGSVPASGAGLFAAWEGAYCGTSTTAIKNAQAQAAAFNSAGDSAAFTPGTSADSKAARGLANLAFWNTLP